MEKSESTKPILVEKITDNGEFSHWELIGQDGQVLWKDDTFKEKFAKEINNIRERIELDTPEDVIHKSEIVFRILNQITEGLPKIQKGILDDLYFDKNKVSKSFDIYQTVKLDDKNEELSLEKYMEQDNEEMKKMVSEMILSDDEISDIERCVLELTDKDYSFTQLESKCIELLGKFVNLTVVYLGVLKQKNSLYLFLSERDENEL
jgi:Glu-tRNA(Gln) amidotransferase subunit E-like FAD-binding protein